MSSSGKLGYPKGWVNVELNEVCEILGGGTPKTKIADYWDGDIVWLSPSDLPAIGEISIIKGSAKKITEQGLNKSSAKLLPKGTVVYSTRASIGKIGIADIPLATNQGFTNFICGAKINNYFLCYCLKHFNSSIEALSNSTTFKEVSKTAVKSFKIPLPPCEEQKRIVAKIDTLFLKIDKAISLTEESLKQAKNLLPSMLKEVFEKGKADGWEEKKLQDICEKITDGTHQTPTYFEEGVVFLSSKNVTSGKINWDNVKYIDDAQHQKMHKRVSPKRKDILLAKNGTTGVAAMVDRDVVFDIYVSLAHIRSLGDLIPELLLYYINSPLAKSQFNKRLKGVGVPNLHLREIREVLVVFPNNKEVQLELVKFLNRALNKSKQTQSKLEEQLAYLRQLKASILSKAFKGEL